MRILNLIVTALVTTGLLATPLPSLAASSRNARVATSFATALEPLSADEIATLTWMREEEKLARDVYIELNAFWPAKIFVNIAESEQRHFDALGKKLALYGLPDPALPNVGDFSDTDLQALHDALLAAGIVSYVEALEVGVTIEETDLDDLEAATLGTDSVPLSRTYEHLRTGSEHHLAAFTRLLERAEAAGD